MVLHGTSRSVNQLTTSRDAQAGAWNNLQVPVLHKAHRSMCLPTGLRFLSFASATRKQVEATYGPDILRLKPVKASMCLLCL